MTGNSGGAYIRDVQVAAYKNGFIIDGSADTIRISEVHCYPFAGINSALMDQNVVWFEIGRVDDLKIGDCLTIYGTHFNFSPGKDGKGATGSLINHDFDMGNVGLQMSGGNLSIMGGYFACLYPIQQSGGMLAVYGTSLSVAENAAVALTGGTLILSGSRNIFLSDGDLNFATQTNGSFTLSDNYFSFKSNSGANLSQPKVNVTNGRFTATGNRVDDRGSGTGSTLFALQQDDFHVVTANAAPGWTFDPPQGRGVGGAAIGVYGANAFSPAGHS